MSTRPRRRRPGPQKIPRPPAARPGGPPPWPELAHGVPRPPVTLADVRAAVARHRPLPELFAADPAAGTSGVLAALFEEGGEARIVLTRRGEWMRSHSHQVAFPGGRVEPGETPLQAALREAHEEVDLQPGAVEIVGALSTMSTISSPSGGIHPFVGVLDGRPVLTPNPHEVERVFDVAVSDLMEEGCYREEIWGVAGQERPIYFFELDGETIWGATARMLHELLSLIAGSMRAR